MVTDAKDKDVVLAVQPSKGSEYAAEAFSVPAEAAFLQRSSTGVPGKICLKPRGGRLFFGGTH